LTPWRRRTRRPRRESGTSRSTTPPCYNIDDGPCDVSISEINRLLHSPEWAEADDFEQDVANAEAIVAAHNALPALIAAARVTVPEVIGKKHRDGQRWQLYFPSLYRWDVGYWQNGSWWSGCGRTVYTPTHALPMPEAPDA